MGEVKPTMIAETSRAMAQRQPRRERPVMTAVALGAIRYRAVWRSKQLLIFPLDCHPFRQSVSAVLEDDRDRLLACLKHSTVRRLLLSPQLPMAELIFWADLGREAGLPIYMRRQKNFVCMRQMSSMVLRLFNMLGAAALLLIFSPVMLLGASLLLLLTGQVVRREWQVGESGQLFQAFLFMDNLVQLPSWLASLNRSEWVRLPTLFNVLRGDVALFKAQSLNQFSSCFITDNRSDSALNMNSAGL